MLAFVPNPAPRELALDPSTIGTLSRAGHAIGELSGASRRLVNPLLYYNALIHREALVSSRIEGTIATPGEVAQAELGIGLLGGDAVEVMNFVKAIRHSVPRLRPAGVSLPLLLDAHRELLRGARGIRGARQTPGEFRMVQNWIGSGPIQSARFVPPPPQELSPLLADLQNFANGASDDLPHLVRVAIAHYQFETIHPFRDGNGRIGRLLSLLMLVHGNMLPHAVLPISTAIEERKAEYMDRMLAVSIRSEWNAWIRFFLECVAESATEALEFIGKLETLRDDWYERVQSTRAPARLMKVVDELFKTPVITIGEAGRTMRVTPAAAAAAIAKLERLGIVTEVTGRKRDRAYYAQSIINLLS